jgi:hypothetical protein
MSVDRLRVLRVKQELGRLSFVRGVCSRLGEQSESPLDVGGSRGGGSLDSPKGWRGRRRGIGRVPTAEDQRRGPEHSERTWVWHTRDGRGTVCIANTAGLCTNSRARPGSLGSLPCSLRARQLLGAHGVVAGRKCLTDVGLHLSGASAVPVRLVSVRKPSGSRPGRLCIAALFAARKAALVAWSHSS